MATMVILHVLVFFISISTAPTQPAPDKSGSSVMWVLYGAPSEQKAHEWAQAQYDTMHAKDDVPQTIKEFLVLPMGDSLCTDKGLEPIQWTKLPTLNDFQTSDGKLLRDDLNLELGSSGHIGAPNKSNAKADELQAATRAKIREMVEKNDSNHTPWNWDDSKAWYYIFYTPHQATLVHSVNMFASTIPYVKAMRGTPLGDEEASITVWQGLTYYNQ
jgi:hypothetical protein